MIKYVFLRVWNYDGYIHFRTYNNGKLYGYDHLDEEVIFGTASLNIKLGKADVGDIYIIPKDNFFCATNGMGAGKWQGNLRPKKLKFEKPCFFVVRGEELLPLPGQTINGLPLDNIGFDMPGMINKMVTGSIIAAWDFADVINGKIIFDWEKRRSDFVPCDSEFELYDEKIRNQLNNYLGTVLPERLMVYKSYTENNKIVLRTYPDNVIMNMANMDIFSELIPNRYYYISRSGTTSFWVTPIEEPDKYNVVVEKRRRAFCELIFGDKKMTTEKLNDLAKNIESIFSPTGPKQEQQRQRVLTPLKMKNPNNLLFYRNVITGDVVQYICLAKNINGDYDIIHKTPTNEYVSTPMMVFFEKIFDAESEMMVPKWAMIDRKEEGYDNINKTLFSV